MIAYASRTGNVEHVVKLLGLPNVKISESMVLDEDYVIFTYTDKLGEVPQIVSSFLDKNKERCKGVIVSGNTNFGQGNFGKAGDTISEKYNVPLICKLDLRGTKKEYETIKKFMG